MPLSYAFFTLSTWASLTFNVLSTAYFATPFSTPLSIIHWGAHRVGTKNVFCCFMSSKHSPSKKQPCSIESTPAYKAFLIPWSPCACVAVFLPALWASSTIIFISFILNCALPGSTPLVITPPVAIILIKSTPALSCVRTAFKQASFPSASIPSCHPWPPVIHMTLPAQYIWGPWITSFWMASLICRS